MDPNAALKAVLTFAVAAHSTINVGGTVPPADLQEFLDNLLALDNYLHSGGFMPDRWGRTPTGEHPDAVSDHLRAELQKVRRQLEACKKQALTAYYMLMSKGKGVVGVFQREVAGPYTIDPATYGADWFERIDRHMYETLKQAGIRDVG